MDFFNILFNQKFGGHTGDFIDQLFAANLGPSERTVSGSIASFSDGADDVPVVDLLVDIDPVQDLNGQDAPYPAGGGVNKFNKAEAVVGYVNDVTGDVNPLDSYKCTDFIEVTEGQSYYVKSEQTNGMWGAWYDENRTYISGITSYANSVITAPSEAHYVRLTILTSQSGNADTFAVNYPSTDTAYHPYSNICPISGHTGAVVQRTGINVWDEEWESGRFNVNTGLKSFGNGLRSKNKISVVPNATYYLTRGNYTGASSFLILYYDANENFISYESKYGTTATITIPSNAHFINLNIQTSEAVTTYNHDISINYPSTDTSYHAYQGQTHSISWATEAGTVYGGTLDVVSGELVVDRAMVRLNTANMNNNNDYPGWRDLAELPGIVGARVNTPVPATLNIGWSAVGVNTTAVTSGILYLPVGTYKKTQDEWKALAMDIEILLHYATPITYQLTPTEVITTLLGDNNIWADTGDITVTYKTKGR